MDVVSILLQIAYLATLLFLYVLLSRFVLGMVMGFGRRWRPSTTAAAVLELIWSITDPPLKALRRVIPALRLGNVSFDLASLVLLVMVFVLMQLVLSPLIFKTA